MPLSSSSIHSQCLGPSSCRLAFRNYSFTHLSSFISLQLSAIWSQLGVHYNMGSKGRIPSHTPHMRRPLPPGAAVSHLEPLGQGMMHPLPGQYPPYDLLPPPKVMEQKLAAQHEEMQRLDYENHRLASTHGTLRQELAAAQHEQQMLHTQIGATKVEGERLIQGIADNIARMEAELQAAEPLKLELQKAQGEAQNLVVSREELVSKAQQLMQELQRTHADVQQIPALISELEGLRQEYQQCRATFEYEKKVYNDHLESLKEMEKNYAFMSREMEKLQAELTNTANVDERSSGPYGFTSGTIDNEASGLPLGQNAYEDGYAVAKGGGPLPTASVVGASATTTAGAQPVPASTSSGYNAPRWPDYDASAGPAYDTQRSVTYDPQRLTGYDAARGYGYDSQRGANFDSQRAGYDAQRGLSYDIVQRGHGYDMQRGPAYDASRGIDYEAQSRGAAGPHGLAMPADNIPYESMTPPACSGGGYEALPRGANPVRRWA